MPCSLSSTYDENIDRVSLAYDNAMAIAEGQQRKMDNVVETFITV